MSETTPAPSEPYQVLRDRSISMEQANLVGLFAGFLGVAICAVWHGLVGGWSQWSAPLGGFFGNPWWIPSVIGGIIVHELIHGLTWTLLGRLPRGSIKYGFDAKTLTPFAHCKLPLTARTYWWGTAAPGLTLGIVPALVGSCLGWPFLTGFGWFMTLVAGGDALILGLLHEESPRSLVRDHPTRCGCEVVEPTP